MTSINFKVDKLMNQIKERIQVAADLNTERSTYRKVLKVDHVFSSKRYNNTYKNGFLVSIGQHDKINVPYEMLEKCIEPMVMEKPYDGEFFRAKFPLQAKDHHVMFM